MTALLVKITLAYLLGSISGSLLLGKLKNVDIRRHGSGNAGGTNAFRTQGLLFALGVVVIDVGKGFVAARWIPLLDMGGTAVLPDASVLIMLCGFAAVIGHCYPIWHGFRGGKGAATAVGALIVIEPWLLLPLALTWLVMLVMTGYVGLATVSAGVSMVPVAWWMNNLALLLFSISLALFLLFTHRANLRKLRDGTENRFERARVFSTKNKPG